jgi:excisionase family DNA binding protein
MTTSVPRLLSVREAAQYLSLSIHTLRTWVCERRIPHIKLGRRVLFRQADLDRFAAQNLINTAD